ncbi:MAG: flap endonuclease-1 [Candidatus Methanomethylicia archaeon]
MGVDFGDVVVRTTLTLQELRGKSIAIDGYNALYQFLTVIRQPDGTPLMDSQGRVTSHLSGVFYRTINLLEMGVKPVYVFDGKPPEIKEMEVARRKALREEAVKKYEEALQRGDLKAARTYASQSARLREEMVDEVKSLLNAMGIPWIQAPSEGEAQAAYLAIRGDVWASASQDYDSLLYGAPKLVRNLTISGRRKLPKAERYVEVVPELVLLSEVLRSLELTREQLIDLAILIGTDYNPDGVKGIGPKRAYMLIKKYGNLENVLKYLPEIQIPSFQAIREIFLKPTVTEDYKVEWKPIDRGRVIEILVEEHDFSRERIEKAIDRVETSVGKTGRQLGLDKWF